MPEANPADRTAPAGTFTVPGAAQRVVVSVNPKAGRTAAGPKVEILAAKLAGLGMQPEVISDLDALCERAEHLQSQGELRGVVASGGDGTAAELANRLGAGIPLAIFPLGTENLLGRHLGYRRADADSLCQTLLDGHGRRLDVGEITWLEDDAPPRLFLIMLSCGFDADVVHRLHKTRKSHISHLSYLKPIWSSLRNYGFPPLHVTPLNAEKEVDTAAAAFPPLAWLFAFNLPCYARNLKIAPDAVATDGLLDWCGYREAGAWNLLRYSLSTWLQRHAALRDCASGRTRAFRVETDRAVPVQIDGDAGGFTPIEVRVIPQRLSLLTPRLWRGGGPAPQDVEVSSKSRS